MAGTGRTVCTLSQVRRWETGHLVAAAEHWDRTATVWEDRFTELAARISSPGGTRWEGVGAESAHRRADADRAAVSGLAEQLRSAAATARAGAAGIGEARRRVIDVVEAAECAGFVVREDFSVSDAGYSSPAAAAARRAYAEALARALDATVGALCGADVRTAGQLAAVTAGLGAAVFPEVANRPAESRSGATALGGSLKRDGGPDPTPEPSDEGGRPSPVRQCVEHEFAENVGAGMVRNGVKSAVKGAVAGALGGGAVLPKGFEPVGALGGGVIGLVGGFSQGLVTAPLTTLAAAAAECADVAAGVTP